jgi:hypothetical protein
MKPLGYWKDIQHQKQFFDHLAIKLNIQKPEDWSKVTTAKVLEEGGSFITDYYNSSVTKGMSIGKDDLTLRALQAVYPESAIVGKRLGYWKDKQNQKAFFDKLAIKLDIQKPEDWNKVTTAMVMKESGYFVKFYYHSSVREGE